MDERLPTYVLANPGLGPIAAMLGLLSHGRHVICHALKHVLLHLGVWGRFEQCPYCHEMAI
eukprot:8858492-Prorocentrum_lima.AAC.1